MRRSAATVIAVLTAVTMGSVPAWGVAAYTKQDAVCRRFVAKGALLLSKQIVREKRICFRKQMQGKAGFSGINCHDILDPAFPGALRLAKKAEKIQKWAQKKCVEGGATTNPQVLGYVFCPKGLAANTCPNVTTTTYVDTNIADGGTDEGTGECFQCLAQELVGDVVEQIYGLNPPGSPLGGPAPSKDAIKCQDKIGLATFKYLNMIMKEQNRCQYSEDLSDPPAGVDCTVFDVNNGDPRGKIARMLSKTLGMIGGKCTPALLGELTSCGTTVTDVQTCFQNQVETRSNELFNDMYVPSPGGVFVSASVGSPAGDGSFLSPVDTIMAGIAAATASSLSKVFIDGGTYNEAITLSSNIQLLGGYNSANNWTNDGSATSVITGNTTAVAGTSVSNVTIDDLNITAGGTTTAGASSYGIRLVSSSGVTISNCSVTAGSGGSGTSGSNGSNGGSANNGGNGGAGTCDAGNGGGGGGGWSPCGRTGGGGGAGGPEGNNNGSSGGTGINGGTAGAGGGGGDPGGTGGNGSSGAAGTNGSNGGGGNGGALNGSGLWAGSSGGNGTSGTNGNGGGGGGGGGGQGCFFCNDGGGNGGGGGGGGGCAGTRGTAGTAGGGSFGIVLYATTATIDSTSIITGNGGSGGNGGVGGTAGSGGTGGAGAGACTSEIGRGGNGANGTAGGKGGHGGGGSGGPTAGIYCAGGGSAIITTPGTYTIGTPGTGGTTGTGGNPGTGGSTGTVIGCP